MIKRILNYGSRRDNVLINALGDGLIKDDGNGGFVRTDKYVGSCAVPSLAKLERDIDEVLWEMHQESQQAASRQAQYEQDLVNGKINGVYG